MHTKSYIFISHASENKSFALNLCESLERDGLKCWIAPRNLRFGANYPEAIMEGISSSAVMIVLVSEHSNKSEHVNNEITRAAHRKVELIPIRIDNSKLSHSMEYFLSTKQWLDLRGNNLSQANRKELVETCKHYLLQRDPNTEQSINSGSYSNNEKKGEAWQKKIMIYTFGFVIISLVGIMWYWLTHTSSENKGSTRMAIHKESVDSINSKTPTSQDSTNAGVRQTISKPQVTEEINRLNKGNQSNKIATPINASEKDNKREQEIVSHAKDQSIKMDTRSESLENEHITLQDNGVIPNNIYISNKKFVDKRVKENVVVFQTPIGKRIKFNGTIDLKTIEGVCSIEQTTWQIIKGNVSGSFVKSGKDIIATINFSNSSKTLTLSLE